MLPHSTYGRTHRTVAPLKQISAKLERARARAKHPGAVLAIVSPAQRLPRMSTSPPPSPPPSPSSPRASAVGSSASYDPQAAYEDKESYSPDLDSLSLHFPLAKHIQRHHTPVSPPPPKHILLPYTPPPPPPRSTISLAPDSGDYLNALSAAVIAGVAVVLLGYACYLRRRSQSVALRARTRLSGEDSASASAAVELELPTESWRRDEAGDTCEPDGVGDAGAPADRSR